jgi:hypothetical protein
MLNRSQQREQRIDQPATLGFSMLFCEAKSFLGPTTKGNSIESVQFSGFYTTSKDAKHTKVIGVQVVIKNRFACFAYFAVVGLLSN